MLDALRNLKDDLVALRKEVLSVKTARIAKKSIRSRAESIGSTWFSDFSEALVDQSGMPQDLVESYSGHFGRLIKISAPNNPKKSYLDTLRMILKSFRDDLILPLQTQPRNQPKVTPLSGMLDSLPSSAESEYLNEAIDCARNKFLRAAVVLGWCAAIDRIHRGIEKTGFARFNVASAEIASRTSGRFKKFSSVQNVSSLSEIRSVFDTVVLWVIEGMGLIDSNQHTRLRSCFDMRCQCAHPGEAPVTEYNLLSYFSDLNEIVFKNDMFGTEHG